MIKLFMLEQCLPGDNPQMCTENTSHLHEKKMKKNKNTGMACIGRNFNEIYDISEYMSVQTRQKWLNRLKNKCHL